MVIRKKQTLGAPYTAEPNQMNDLGKPIKKVDEADPTQITEEFPEREDSKPDINDM